MLFLNARQELHYLMDDLGNVFVGGSDNPNLHEEVVVKKIWNKRNN